MPKWLAVLSLSIICYSAFIGVARTAQDDSIPGYVGSSACLSCHEDQASAWRQSHHALAWQLPTDQSVLGDFADTSFEKDDVLTQFTKDGDSFHIAITDPEGSTTQYDVVGTAGVAPLQQYLVDTGAGRLQALDVSWDVDREQWFHLYPDQDFSPSMGLHWTGPYKNWNSRCAECHATGYVRSYDPSTRSYSSTQSEIGVGCEACHGPGEAHVAWAEHDQYDTSRYSGLSEQGLTIDFGALAETEIQQCAGCHSRREAFQDGNPLPGTAYHNAYRLALLRDGLYHADGTILDEVYVYGSFLQSKMYANGVRCSNCHDIHSAELKAEGNAVCTQCHSPAGNPDFPSLRLADYDSLTHHHHDDGSGASECKSCHMVERVYMQVDPRRDHSFRVPRPDLSEATSAPNACNDCHNDQTPAWAAAQINEWYPDSQNRKYHYGQTLALGRLDPRRHKAALIALANDTGASAIVRATALDLIARASDEETATRLESALRDSEPLVRAAAIPVQAGAAPADRQRRLLTMVEDPVKSVRIAAARDLLDMSIETVSEEQYNAVAAAVAEWQLDLKQKADFPESQMAMGGAALATRNWQAALAAFREAVRLDPQMVQAWRLIILLEAALGDKAGAETTLEQAISHNPDNPVLETVSRQLQSN